MVESENGCGHAATILTIRLSVSLLA
jgi:hypothetical protein